MWNDFQASYDVSMQGRRKRGGWGALASQFLAKQLTLSQQEGRLCMPITVIQAPQIFRPCDGPGIFSQA